MAENKEEKEELTDKTEQSEQETQNEETPKAEQEEAKDDDLATKLEELNKKYLLLYSTFSLTMKDCFPLSILPFLLSPHFLYSILS